MEVGWETATKPMIEKYDEETDSVTVTWDDDALRQELVMPTEVA